MHNHDHQGAFLSVNAKPRLKWTQQLHRLFVRAVLQLGGPRKATPKLLMRTMGVPGLTLYHLKSHLQKYRLTSYRDSQTNHDQQDTESEGDFMEANESQEDCNETTSMQIDVEREMQHQIEVQRHLQLRIEAQGKYLQSVLNKAQETLAATITESSCVTSTASTNVDVKSHEPADSSSSTSNCTFNQNEECGDDANERSRKRLKVEQLCQINKRSFASEESNCRLPQNYNSISISTTSSNGTRPAELDLNR